MPDLPRDDPPTVLSLLLKRESRLWFAWAVALTAGSVALGYAWTTHNDARRSDDNCGHALIDFGAQWLLARMVVEGRGHELYHRPALQEVAERHFPKTFYDPTDEGDAARLMGWMISGEPFGRDPDLGGPLYPPVHAVLFAPLTLLPPRLVYRLTQIVNLLLVFLIGRTAERLSGGRVWWPVASFLIMVFPGYAGVINLGQNSALSLFLLVAGWSLAVGGREATGGVLWGLLAFKPTWAASFFLVPLLTRRWRMALAMGLTGAGLVLLTLPFVGVGAWREWLEVGRMASALYAHDGNWLPLSRDLSNLPRRWFRDAPTDPLPTRLGLALWLASVGATAGLALVRPRAVRAAVGPGPAFVYLGAWLSCFHFMYYDSILASLGVFLIFADPNRYVVWQREPADGWRLRPFPLVVLALVIVLPYVFWASHVYLDWPPADTIGLLALWAWCGGRTSSAGG